MNWSKSKNIIIKIISVSAILFAMLFTWLIATESGFNWSTRLALKTITNDFTIKDINGRWIGPVSLIDIKLQLAQNDIAIETLSFDWKLTSLFTGKLDIIHIELNNTVINETSNVNAVSVALKHTDAPKKLQLENFIPPIDIDIQSLLLNNIRISLKDDTKIVDQISASVASNNGTILLKSLKIHSDFLDLYSQGQFDLNTPNTHQLDSQWKLLLSGNKIIDGEAGLSGNASLSELNLTTSNLVKTKLTALINNPLDKFSWSAEVKLSELNPALVNTALPELVSNIDIKASGNLQSAEVTGDITGQHPVFKDFSANLHLYIEDNKTINIKTLNYLSLDNKAKLQAVGWWKPTVDNEVSLLVTWQDISWRFNTDLALKSKQGKIKLNGTINDYQLNTDSEANVYIKHDNQHYDQHITKLQLLAKGTTDSINIKSLKANILEGDLNASGLIHWQPDITWDLKLNTDKLNLTNIDSLTIKHLTTQLITQGQFANGQMSQGKHVVDVTAMLPTSPLSLNAVVTNHNSHFSVNDFKLKTNNNVATADISLTNTINAAWKINAKDLNELWPSLKGNFVSDGMITGLVATPTLKLMINSNSINYKNISLSNLSSNIYIDSKNYATNDVTIQADYIYYDDIELSAIDIVSTNNKLKLNFETDNTTNSIQAEDLFSNKKLTAKLTDINVKSVSYQDWALAAPVEFAYLNNNINVQPLCLKSVHETKISMFCSDLKHNENNNGFNGKITGSDIPLTVLDIFLPDTVKINSFSQFEGVFNYSLINKEPNLIVSFNAKLDKGFISYPIDNIENHWQFETANLNIDLQDKTLTASSAFIFSNNEAMRFNARLPEFYISNINREEQQLEASIDFNTNNLSIINALTPDIQNLQGLFLLNAELSGKLAKPKLSTKSTLSETSFDLPKLGLVIKNVNFEINKAVAAPYIVTAYAESGNGQLSISGHSEIVEINNDDLLPKKIKLRIKGNNFEASKSAELQLSLSPDINIEIDNQNINIFGDIIIPYAKFEPKDKSQMVTSSDDIVIIGEEKKSASNWNINTKVKLKLGERIHLYGYGFEGRLGGELLIENNNSQLTKATGEIAILEGRYRAYGQRLDVEHGRLIYTASPISNPGLDIKAVRKTNNITAGINAKGSLNQPKIELFSSPAMGETDALSYLVLGRPMESTTTSDDGALLAKAALAIGLSQGDQLARLLGNRFGIDEMRIESSERGDQASLVVGRYLSPELYVSYGLGLIESINTVALRYQISKQWQLKAESGEATGADIFYTIDK